MLVDQTDRGEGASPQKRRRRRRKRGLTTVVLTPLVLLACAVGLAACGGGTNASSGSSSSGGKGGTLTIADPGFPSTQDPGMGENALNVFYSMAYDPLIVQAPDGSFKPGLALSWDYGPRNESFSMKLRPHVTFSDGTKFDAEAVKLWIEHVKNLPGGAGGGYLASLKSIDVTSPLSLTLKFSAPTPLLELVFSQILGIGQVGSPKAVKAGTLKTEPVGAGPYVLDKAETVPRDHYTYTPNPKYWNPSEIHWEKVVIKTISNPNAALQALKTNQVQVVQDQPVESIAGAESAGLEYVAPKTLLLALQFTDRDGELLKPLGSLKVRQAINYAIDRKSVGELLGQGHGEEIAQMAAKGDDSFVPELQNRYPYDIEKAKELMSEAGYPNGFSLKVLSINAVGQNVLAEALVGQLSKIGIKVEPDVKTDLGEYASKGASTEYPAETLSWGRLPAVTDYQLLWGPEATMQNPFKNHSPKLEAIYEELIAAPPAKSDAIAQEMQRFLVEEAWFAPVEATPLVILHQPSVAGVEATDDRDVTWPHEYRPAG